MGNSVLQTPCWSWITADTFSTVWHSRRAQAYFCAAKKHILCAKGEGQGQIKGKKSKVLPPSSLRRIKKLCFHTAVLEWGGS